MYRANLFDLIEKPISLSNIILHHRYREHLHHSMEFWQQYPLAPQQSNGDEEKYADRRGNFSKGLPHDECGRVEQSAYNRLLQTLSTATLGDFDSVLSALPASLSHHFVHQQTGMLSGLIGPDAAHLALPAPSAFGSIDLTAELVENYWMSQMRDIHFADYATNAIANEAVADFEQALSGNLVLRKILFKRDPNLANQPLTPNRILRGTFIGERVGPYLSQFLLQDCFVGSQQLDQRMRTVQPEIDYMTDFDTWLAVQQGVKQPRSTFDAHPRFIRNGRDLGHWVQQGFLFQPYSSTCLQLLANQAELNPTNPYRNVSNQAGYTTFGGAHVLSLVTEVAARAVKAIWYQKWAIHRRLRPEALAARIHTQFVGAERGHWANFDIAPTIQETQVIHRLFRKQGSLLLPMALPEGSPQHPSYGSGFAAVAGACTTILKAWFHGAQKFHNLCHAYSNTHLQLLQASPSGLTRVLYNGDDVGDLTVEGELNKLAGNVAMAGVFAGVHFRSDARESLLLGEKVAIGSLLDYTGMFNDPHVRFRFNSFTGHNVEVGAHQVWIDGNAVIFQSRSFSEELSALDT